MRHALLFTAFLAACFGLNAAAQTDEQSTDMLGTCVLDGEDWQFGWSSLQRLLDTLPGATESLGFESLDGDCNRARATFDFSRRSANEPDASEQVGATEDTNGSEDELQSAIAGGLPSNYMPSVVLEFPRGNTVSTCTGVLVNANYLLTSAHCIPGPIEPRNRDVQFRVNLQTLDGNQLVCLTGPGVGPVGENTCANGFQQGRAFVHPDYDGGQWGNYDDEDDLAVIRFVPGWREVDDAPLEFAFFERHGISDGDWVTIDGYSFGNRSGEGRFIRRRGVFKVRDVDSRDIEFRNRASVQVCRGDSGSPLRHRVDEVNLVVGLLSTTRVDNPGDLCGKPGGKTQATRIWPKQQWIEAVLQRQCVERGRYARCFTVPGDGSGGGPPPPICGPNQRCCEPALGGGCMLCVPNGFDCP